MSSTPLLVTPAELRERLAKGEDVTLLDVRWRLTGPSARPDYEQGHLPGAAFVDLESELTAPPGDGGRHPLPDEAVFTAAMRRAGVRNDVPVVCYDAREGSSAAARCWWLLTYYGHPRVSLLDGGLEGWVRAGEGLEAGEVEPQRGDFQPQPGHLEVLDAHSAADRARQGVLLDARAGERYRGESEPIDPVAGHVPGALSAPATENVDELGRFLSPEELQLRFKTLGVEGDKPVGVYCGSGVVAAHEVFALRLAGIDAALYPGSWSGWIRDPQRPVATGAQPG